MAGVQLSLRLVADNVKIKVSDLLNPPQIRLVAETGLALLKRRITLHHKRADGSTLSPYSTKPISVRVAGIGTGNPMLRPRGGKLSKSKKYMRFEGGYRQVRDKAGRTTQKDLTISGNLTGKRFRVLSASGDSAIVGWPAGSTQAKAAAGLHAQEKSLVFLWSENEMVAMERTAEWLIGEYFAEQGWAEEPPTLNIADLEG